MVADVVPEQLYLHVCAVASETPADYRKTVLTRGARLGAAVSRPM